MIKALESLQRITGTEERCPQTSSVQDPPLNIYLVFCRHPQIIKTG